MAIDFTEYIGIKEIAPSWIIFHTSLCNVFTMSVTITYLYILIYSMFYNVCLLRFHSYF